MLGIKIIFKIDRFLYSKIFWRLLKKSRIFQYWHKRFLSDLLFELERYDLDGRETYDKYLTKYQNLYGQK